MADEPNLFGVKPKAPRPHKADPLPAGTMKRLIGLWCKLFESRFGVKPAPIRERDAHALKRTILFVGEPLPGDTDQRSAEDKVAEKIRQYFALDDDYAATEGYPLSLLPDRWNKLVAASAKPQGRVPDADSTDRYLRGLRRR